jgi:hypothetical protein
MNARNLGANLQLADYHFERLSRAKKVGDLRHEAREMKKALRQAADIVDSFLFQATDDDPEPYR